MTTTMTVKPNKKLKALLDKHPDACAKLKQESDDTLIAIMPVLNAWANLDKQGRLDALEMLSAQRALGLHSAEA